MSDKTWFRVSYDGYIESEYETEAEARQEFIDIIDNVLDDELTVEKFSAEKGVWE